MIKWSFPISIWAKWVKDETEVSGKCFDHDWELTKERVPKALKEDESEMKRIKLMFKP